MTVDFLDALTAYLRADSGIAALAGARVYPAELPATEAASMPRYAVTIVPSGGGGEASDLAYQTPRVDVFCYAATPKQARMLYFEVARALQGLRRNVHALTLLHTATPSAGPLMGRTPEAWPMAWGSWQIRAGTGDAS